MREKENARRELHVEKEERKDEGQRTLEKRSHCFTVVSTIPRTLSHPAVIQWGISVHVLTIY